MAGLSALCFLEQVDQLIGKDHLFKRSIILIKAWCFYESRILGALHGLLSTYAVDLLVLHIVNLFHASLNGPLSVLYRFLNYYSTFDWDKYCVSLNGPVAISSLPEIVVQTPQNDGNELLLSWELLKNDIAFFSLSTWALETRDQAFPVKHLNIIDPLKDNNNLGRSVCEANFRRIKYALSYGAGKLGEILTLPPETIGAGLKNFFVNTLKRNGMGRRPDVGVPVPVYGVGNAEISELSGDYGNYFANLVYGLHYHNPNPSIQSRPTVSPSQVWNESAGLQLNQNFVSLSNLEGFELRPFFCPSAAQPLIAGLGDEEITEVQMVGPYTPTLSVEEKLKLQGMGSCIPNMMGSRGTGTFIPDIQIREKLKSQITARCILGMGVEEMVKSGGSGTLISNKVAEVKYKCQVAVTKIPNMDVEENYQPIGTAMYFPDMGVEEYAKSRGTGTYNHDMGVEENIEFQRAVTQSSDSSKNPYKEIIVRRRGNDGQTSHGLMVKSSLKNEQLNVSSEMEGQSSSCLDFSVEEFPFLPGAKAVPAKTPTPQTDQPTVKSQAQKPSLVIESIEFGFFEPSLSPLVQSSPTDSKPAESSEHKKEMVLVQQFKLEDEEDFPPLFCGRTLKKGVWGGREKKKAVTHNDK